MAIDLLKASPEQLSKIRGKRISMIFQDPMTSLNPYLRISEQLIEPLLIHEKISRDDALKRGIAMLEPKSACRTPRNASAVIRTNFPAACASA